jgi:putative MFS transporter
LTIVVELTPTRYRTFATSFYVVFASAGGFLAPAISAALMGPYGWRRVALLGFIALIIGILVWIFTPESVRWLTAKGRFAEAQATVARTLGLPLAAVPLPAARPASEPGHGLAELLVRPRLFWLTFITWMGSATAIYGIYLWGPTIIALLLKMPVARAAHYFVYVALAGIAGKVLLSWLAHKIGRKRVGEIQGYLGALGLVVAGACFPLTIGGFPVFILALVATVLFLEGGASNLAPYIVEVYGVRLGARSAGLSQAANGVGKILGPLCLAVIAGADNPLSPQATADAVLPAFLFLGACSLAVGIAVSFLGPETHGRPLAQDHDEEGVPSRALEPAEGRP